MYEKKINISNDIDRELSIESFRYNIVFAILICLVIFMLLFVKKKYYYQNIINFKDNKSASIVVSKNDVNNIKNHNEIIFNNLSMRYYIDNIEEKEDYYLFNIHFDIEVNVNSNIYKILLCDESLFKYVARIIGG